MKNLKKITALICAAALAGGVCTACACGGGTDTLHKPEIPSGVEKVSEEQASEKASEFIAKYNKAKNLTFDGYEYLEDNYTSTYVKDGVTNSVLNKQIIEKISNLRALYEGETPLGDVDYKRSEESEYTNIACPDDSENFKYNYTGEKRLRGDTVYNKYTDGEVTRNGTTERVGGLNYYKKVADPVKEFTYNTYNEAFYILDVTYLLNDYANYKKSTDMYYPDGSADSEGYPKNVVKTFEIDLRLSETKLYFSYLRIIDYTTQGKDYQGEDYNSSAYKKSEYVFVADISAGLTESDFKAEEITEKDTENVLYVNPDLRQIVAKLKAGEKAEITPIGGGKAENLQILLFGDNGSTIKKFNFKDGKFVLEDPLTDFSGSETIRLEARYGYINSGSFIELCKTEIEYIPE